MKVGKGVGKERRVSRTKSNKRRVRGIATTHGKQTKNGGVRGGLTHTKHKDCADVPMLRGDAHLHGSELVDDSHDSEHEHKTHDVHAHLVSTSNLVQFLLQ